MSTHCPVSYPSALGYLPELDGLRAIAVLMVITRHMHSNTWDWLSGQRGVTVFFVISGYLITELALREEARSGRLSLAAFYVRRAFRIFPLYYVVLATYAALIFGTHGWTQKAPLFRADLPYFLFYVQEYPFFHSGSGGMPFYQSWSLGIEEKFYLVWPALCFMLLRFHPRARIILPGVLLVVLPLLGPFFAPYASIMIGCMLALVLWRLPVRHWIASHPAVLQAGVWLGLSGIIAMHCMAPVHGSNPWREVAYSFVVGCFLATLLYSRSPIRLLLASKILSAVGRVSYGIYLVHILCINAVEHLVRNPVAAYLSSIVVSIAVASLLHISIERPLIAAGRRLAKKIRTRPILEPVIADCRFPMPGVSTR